MNLSYLLGGCWKWVKIGGLTLESYYTYKLNNRFKNREICVNAWLDSLKRIPIKCSVTPHCQKLIFKEHFLDYMNKLVPFFWFLLKELRGFWCNFIKYVIENKFKNINTKHELISNLLTIFYKWTTTNLDLGQFTWLWYHVINLIYKFKLLKT